MAHLEGNRARSTFQPKYSLLSDLRALRLPSTEHWLPAGVALIGLGTWEWMVHTHLLSALFFPAPSHILQSLVRQMSEGTLMSETLLTLRRVALGLLLGGLPGLAFGLIMGWSHTLRRLVEPFVAAAHPIPKIAILPLIMVIVGIGESPIVIVAATGAFFPILLNTLSGVEQIDRLYFQVAKSYGADAQQILRRVVLPGSLPFMLTGLLLALNVTLLLTIAVEMVSGRTGLGGKMWFAWETMRVDELYVSLIVVMLLGIGFNLLLHLLTKRLAPWRLERDV